MLSTLVAILLLSVQAQAAVTPGVSTSLPPGYLVSNIDPNLNSTRFNNEIYDPNFIPGFGVGLPNVSISWTSGLGYARVGYAVGPWSHQLSAMPHFAMGPQCCNFVEVPHTQQFRLPSWGDFYYVRSGLGAPGVNVQNFTAVFGGPTSYVGLRTDWNWTVRVSLDWTDPVLSNPKNQWAAIGMSVTQYVPSAPKKLVNTLVNFWMDGNSSQSLRQRALGVPSEVSQNDLVTYHPLQLSSSGNQTVTINLSPFLEDTLKELKLVTDKTQPPVISYVYLNVEGYNFRWNSTVWSFYLLSPLTSVGGSPQVSDAGIIAIVAALLALGGAVAGAHFYRTKKRAKTGAAPCSVRCRPEARFRNRYGQ